MSHPYHPHYLQSIRLSPSQRCDVEQIQRYLIAETCGKVIVDNAFFATIYRRFRIPPHRVWASLNLLFRTQSIDLRGGEGQPTVAVLIEEVPA